ncbi:unnamed protein product [Moneuplotes crassus]|uniref:Uncharacterized protein n=1 Tax=Euplotes crassus TaxID=5936 RepID=A0AAD1Y0U1_EUPCR|nr:unnamed protein product [Moneuplotes crassus]
MKGSDNKLNSDLTELFSTPKPKRKTRSQNKKIKDSSLEPQSFLHEYLHLKIPTRVKKCKNRPKFPITEIGTLAEVPNEAITTRIKNSNSDYLNNKRLVNHLHLKMNMRRLEKESKINPKINESYFKMKKTNIFHPNSITIPNKGYKSDANHKSLKRREHIEAPFKCFSTKHMLTKIRDRKKGYFPKKPFMPKNVSSECSTEKGTSKRREKEIPRKSKEQFPSDSGKPNNSIYLLNCNDLSATSGDCKDFMNNNAFKTLNNYNVKSKGSEVKLKNTYEVEDTRAPKKSVLNPNGLNFKPNINDDEQPKPLNNISEEDRKNRLEQISDQTQTYFNIFLEPSQSNHREKFPILCNKNDDRVARTSLGYSNKSNFNKNRGSTGYGFIKGNKNVKVSTKMNEYFKKSVPAKRKMINRKPLCIPEFHKDSFSIVPCKTPSSQNNISLSSVSLKLDKINAIKRPRVHLMGKKISIQSVPHNFESRC